MSLLEAIVLGIVQGLTEFLPVSSSGHIEIGKVLFGVDAESSFYFTVAVHGATVLSTIAVFRKEIGSLLRGFLKFRMNDETSYILKILVSMIPVGFVGLLMKDQVEALFNGNLLFVGAMLIITAALLASAHFIRKKERQIGYPDALIIGVAQALAVIPGISRSGATIATGLMIGNSKNEIARFSFLMVLIPVLGANFLELLKTENTMAGPGTAAIIAGSLAAFVSGFFACRWMIGLVRKSRLIGFSVYCAAAGLLVILLG
jgi:undecaprenyl-diphosphatase